MPPYIYSKLDVKTQDIRLITLLPGNFDDTIRLSISHEPFIIPMERPAAKVSLEEIQKTLPDNWTAFETLEGRIYYDYADPTTGLGPTSWTHPNPQMDPTGGGSRHNDIAGFHANFEALSYTWGSAENPEVIYVEVLYPLTGASTTALSTLKIGQNLACALRHLRYIDTLRVLWVDAICINQQDLEERATQVVRMGNIYKFARRVVVWLGPRSANSGLAISTLTFLGKQVEVNNIYGRSPAPDCTQPLWYTASYALPYTEEVWEAIHDLLESPWFKRLWILQEIQLASQDSTMMCGNDEISWYLFRRSVKCLYAKQKGVPRKLSMLLPNIDRLSMYLIGSRLQRLLAISRERKCAESSDKVYAILGLVPPVIASKIRPNYSISPADVYKSTFLEHVSLVHRLELLVTCNIQGQKTVGLPSWAPDWSREISEEVGFFTDSYCTGYSSSQTRFLPPDILEVTGVKCLTISTVGDYLLNNDDDILNAIQGLGTEKLMKDSYVTGDGLLDAYAWTMSRGQLRDRFHKVTIDPSVEEMKKFILDKAQGISEEQIGNIPINHFSRLTRYTGMQKLVSTDEGYIGLGVSRTQPGDIVCLFLGCPEPMLLRQRSEDTFEVVGNCYLHGIMNGEALLGPLPNPWECRLQIIPNGGGYWEPWYWNSVTKTLSQEDPRLGELPPEWEKIAQERTPDDPLLLSWHRNKVTGEVINSDPRLLPESLIARGVKVENFRLI